MKVSRAPIHFVLCCVAMFFVYAGVLAYEDGWFGDYLAVTFLAVVPVLVAGYGTLGD